jgi:phospholipase C
LRAAGLRAPDTLLDPSRPSGEPFTFDTSGIQINSNPYLNGYVTIQHVPSDCTLRGSASQSWNDTHKEINGGRTDGFAQQGVDSLAYWDHSNIPFCHSLANTPCLANRWVCSAPLPDLSLIWLYDEHGGNYEHVPPSGATPPDSIAPKLSAGNVPGGYDIYGPGVPAVVVSG